MVEQRTLGIEGQAPPHFGEVFRPPAETVIGSLLGNTVIQVVHLFIESPAFYSLPTANEIRHHARLRGSGRVSKLEALKRSVFTAEGKAERVARSLAALAESDRVIIRLTPEDWKLVAEDPDLEDDF